MAEIEQRARDLQHARAALPDTVPGSLSNIEPPRFPKVPLRGFVTDKDHNNG